MNDNPMISVVMPVYNCEKYIREAIDSILNQTYGNFELLIINNASTDKTVDLVQQYNDARIRILNNEKNMGLLYSLQRGVEEARGELIARLDGDDICLDTRFEKQVKYLKEHPDVWLCGTKVKAFSHGKQMNVRLSELCDDRYIKFTLPFYDCVAHSSFMFRKKILAEANIKYRGSNYCQDYFMLFDVAFNAKIGLVDEYLVMLRFHPEQTTSTFSFKSRENDTHRAKREYIVKLPFLKAEKRLLYGAVCGKLTTIRQLLKASNLIQKYAVFCQLDMKKAEDRKIYLNIIQYYFGIQRQSMNVLIAFMLCKDTDKRALITNKGKIL